MYVFGYRIVEAKYINFMSVRISNKDTRGATIIQLSPRKFFESGASIPKNNLYGGTGLLSLNKIFSSVVAHDAHSVHNP